MVEIDLGRQWGFSIGGSYFIRKTHYSYYDDVRANTFEIKAGLTYHL